MCWMGKKLWISIIAVIHNQVFLIWTPMRSSLFPLPLTATAFIQGLQVSYQLLAVAFQLVSLPPLLSHSTSSFTVSRIIFLEELSQLRFQSGSEKILSEPLSFHPSFLFQFHLLPFFVVAVQLQLSCLFPHCSPLPHPPTPTVNPPSLFLPTNPLFVFLCLHLPFPCSPHPQPRCPHPPSPLVD